MTRLPHQLPAWVAGHSGVPFIKNGRDRVRDGGLDCYGLVRAVYASQFGVHLPAFVGSADQAIAEQLEPPEDGALPTWVEVHARELQVGDVGVFRIGEEGLHTGVIVSRTHMLHTLEGTQSCVERFASSLWAPRTIGFHRYAGGVHLVARNHPFSNLRVDVTLPAGSTLEELIAIAGVQVLPGLRAFIAGVEVPREMWCRVRPRPGRLVTLACVPEGGGGGGKDTLRIVLSIAVLAASVALPGSSLFAGTIFATSKFAAAALSAGIAIGGTLAINALVPAPRPRLSDNGPTGGSPTIQGTRNEARPYAPVPVILGRHRLAPALGAAQYTEVVGDEQYLRCLFVIGYGPLKLEDFRIGETPLEDFEGVELQVHHGYPNGRKLSLYPATVHELPLSVLLEQSASWQTRTTQADIEEIAVDITFPLGLVTLDRAGAASNRTVDVEVEYRAVGSGTWLKVNGDAGAVGSPTTENGLDHLFRTPEVTYGGAGFHSGPVRWGSGFPSAKPGYLPATGYSWMAESYVLAETAGNYEFGIDGSDACDLEVDRELVASWYGVHNPQGGGGTPNFTGHTGTIFLEPGYHHIRVRVESRSANGGAIAVGWKPPGAGSFAIIPSGNLDGEAGLAGGLLAGQWRYRWFNTGTYRSNFQTTAAKSEQVRRSLTWAVPTGQYEVRLRRTTADTTDPRILDKVYWTALRSIDDTDPVQMAGVARVAIRIKATDQLAGVVDQFNLIATSIVREYDQVEDAWIRRATRNPAALYRHVLQGRANHRPVADARIDLAELESWSVDCVTKGWTFDAVIDFPGTVYERLNDVAAAGRASFGMRNGLYSIVRDKPQTVPVQVFTPRNSRGFRGSKVFATLPHAFRVRFLNAAKDYQEDERIVLDDGYQLDGKDAFGNAAPGLPAATIFEELQFFGATSPDLAWKHGRYYIAVARLRPEVYEFETDLEHLVCSRGDLVLLTHDVPLLGLAAGRIQQLNHGGGGELLSIDVDEACPMDAVGPYTIRVRFGDGLIWSRSIIAIAGEHRKLFFTVPVPAGDPKPQRGDLFVYGPTGQETRELVIKSIDIDRDLGGRITAVDHAPAVHTAETGTIPPFDSGITRPPVYNDGPGLPEVESIRSDDFVMIRDAAGNLRPRIMLTLKRQSGTRPYAAFCQVRVRVKEFTPAPTVGPWTAARTVPVDNNQIGIDDVVVGRTYQISLRYLTAAGRAGPWQYFWVPVIGGPTVVIEHTVIGQTLPPPDPVSFDVRRLSDGTREYTWDLGVVPPDIAGVHIRWGPVGGTWDDLVPLHQDVLQSSPAELNVPEAGTWRFGLKAVDVAGNESVNAILIDRTLGWPRLEGVAFLEDAALLGWPGTKTNCFVSGPDRFLEATDVATWDTLLSGHSIATWNGFFRWNVNPRSPITYEHPPIDAGLVYDFTPDCLWRVEGNPTVEVAWSTDGVTYSAWTNVIIARQASVSARFLKARIRVAATGSLPVAVIRSFVVMMRSEPVVHEIQDLNTATMNPMNILGIGDVRLPVPFERFHLIRSIGVTFNGMGAGYSWELVDKDPALGPRIRIYDAQDQLTHATIDAVIRGL